LLNGIGKDKELKGTCINTDANSWGILDRIRPERCIYQLDAYPVYEKDDADDKEKAKNIVIAYSKVYLSLPSTRPPLSPRSLPFLLLLGSLPFFLFMLIYILEL